MQYFVAEMYAVFCTGGEGAKVATMILVSTKVPIATHCTYLLGHFWARAGLMLLFRGSGGLVVAGNNSLFTI